MKGFTATEGTPALMKKPCKEVRCIDAVAASIVADLKSNLKIPIHFVSHLDVYDFELDEPYCMYVLGNEVHNSFDRKFEEDKNCRAIIKPYPYIPNYSPVSVAAKKVDCGKTKYTIEVGKEDPRILNLPLGHSTSFLSKNEEKNIPIGFYGQTSGIRQQIVSCFDPRFLSSKVYNGFGIDKGSEDYSEFLAKCHVALVPTGHSPETYRLYEAALAGCALFGTPLPETEYYNECPIVSIPWQYFQGANFLFLMELVANEIFKDLENCKKEAASWARKWTNSDFLAKKAFDHIKTFG